MKANQIKNLEINKLRLNNSGTYTCKVRNKVGVSTAHFFVKVDGEVKAEVKSFDPKNVVITEGDSISFTCSVLSGVKPEIWFLKRISNTEFEEIREETFLEMERTGITSKMLPVLSFNQSSRYLIIEKRGGIWKKNGSYVSTFALHNLQPNESGEYACYGWSNYGIGFRRSWLGVHPKIDEAKFTSSNMPYPPLSTRSTFLLNLPTLSFIVEDDGKIESKAKPNHKEKQNMLVLPFILVVILVLTLLSCVVFANILLKKRNSVKTNNEIEAKADFSSRKKTKTFKPNKRNNESEFEEVTLDY
ncbi:fibroblast growth factor receptor-like 1 [Dinothrombium tinctorium]|uniref:Fibroblast growth factor receptor-like 1 n=1 Tax=Dinothrombium tinctorium TaxID=1965070 RepID=A0A443RJE5_9ACAR|nr:fibroblast growth factor receptor-like 1 [Dinothrombium tinctorium]